MNKTARRKGNNTIKQTLW